jgi:hypothetical protein
MTADGITNDRLAKEVLRRSEYTTAEDVRRLASLANAERQFGREYHGRFVIELLQNAADGWRKVAARDERSKVRIILDHGPTLTVANQGEVLSADTIIKSLGHIGASTKPHGEAIGHKGIGFKSVLEMSLAPEVYSGFTEGEFEVGVRFDAERALTQIRANSPDWDDLLAEVTGLSSDPLSPIPVLQFPFRMDAVPDEVADLGRGGYTTVIRLAFDPAHSDRLQLTADAWEAVARGALEDVTDEIVLLLDTFEQVILEDRILGTRVEITQAAEAKPRKPEKRVRATQVVIRRNGEVSSRWRLYRETLPDAALLEGDIVVGVPLAADATDQYRLASTVASAPFHLFFPTRIASGTPFLLHGYFEVAAGRASFYGGSESKNRSLLKRLSRLAGVAVHDSANTNIDLGPLAELLGKASPPEDSLARWFQDETTKTLDHVSWVPTRAHPSVPPLVTPLEALAFVPAPVGRRLADAFDNGYTWSKTHAATVNHNVDDTGLGYLASRRTLNEPPLPDLWQSIRSLATPGDESPWQKGSEDQGFLNLLELIALLETTDRARARGLIGELKGNRSARIVPAVAADGARELVPPPAPPEPGSGRRSQLILARLREREAGELVPPAELQVSFIRDQLLDSQLLAGPASSLGVQEYVVDNILDRLDGLAMDDGASQAIVDFLWRLLVREPRSVFGLRRSLAEMAGFEPGRWFWFHPGRAEGSDADRQRRERGLASLLLPSRANDWIPASQLAFGDDWAQWLEAGEAGPPTSAARERIAAYRDLELLAPSPDRLLAPPAEIAAVLPDIPLWAEAWSDELSDEHRLNVVRHGFLLRLGVWEVPPVEVFSDRRDRTKDRIPWPGPLRDRLLQWVASHGGWKFPGYGTYEHDNVTIGEDFRFEWSFEGRDPEPLARSIARTSGLCRELSHLFAFCPGCRTHRTRYATDTSTTFPSRLALQLQTAPWLPCVKDGSDVPRAVSPSEAWWEPALPERSNIQQSPLRYLSIVRPGTHLPEGLRELAGLPQLSTARLARITDLLVDLRDTFLDGKIDPDPTRSKLAKQAFVGIHRAAYERLAAIAINSPERAHAAIEAAQVLCDAGGGVLEYTSPTDARHDDGRFASFRRYFTGSIPFCVIARDREAVPRRLGIKPFDITFVRRDRGEGTDVTDEVASLVGDRVVEFLAIVVNHSLGTQTLELGSPQFQERARRLERLRVVRVDQLILDAAVVGTDIRASIGERAGFDVFLEEPTSGEPVLYHDLEGDGWKEALRRKLGEHIAAVLENSAYTATFTLFLQHDTEADREDFLLELGVTPEDVDAVRLALGVVSQTDRGLRRVWFASILDAAGASPNEDHAEPDEETGLVNAGLQRDIARRLVELGGGVEVRADVRPGGALAVLVGADISLERLHAALVERGDPGLSIRVATDRLRDWKARYARYVAAVLATKVSDVAAKAQVERWTADPALRFVLDPPANAVISPVVGDLRRAGLDPNTDAFASEDPIPELARLAGCASRTELDHRVLLLFDAEERSRILRGLAHAWRRHLRLIGVLVRAAPHEPRSATRIHGDEVERILPLNPHLPSDLQPHLPALLLGASGLAAALTDLLADEVTASPPTSGTIATILTDHGFEPSRLDEIEKVLAMPARTEARRLRGQMDQLADHSVDVSPPAKRSAPPKRRRRSSVVRTVHLAGSEPRRRQVGDEGERWALAAIIKPLLDHRVREEAIPAIVAVLRTFEGEAVERALAHADAVADPDLDEEELIDELTALLHVAKYSDDFGFDVLGWLPPAENADSIAMALEVKSSGEGTFHFSAGEWERATQFRDDGRGESYAVLVIRRRSGPAPVPERLDLLVDPVTQYDDGQLSRWDDGYVISY